MPNQIHMIILIELDGSGRTQFVPTISRIIKQFKGSITKQIGFSIWQLVYFEPILGRLVLPSFRAAVPQSGSKEGGARRTQFAAVILTSFRVTGDFVPRMASEYKINRSIDLREPHVN